jgi:hypothetical protein
VFARNQHAQPLTDRRLSVTCEVFEALHVLVGNADAD